MGEGKTLNAAAFSAEGFLPRLGLRSAARCLLFPRTPAALRVFRSCENILACRVHAEVATAERETEAALKRTIYQTINVVPKSGTLGAADGRIGQLALRLGLSTIALFLAWRGCHGGICSGVMDC
jgi:hypothetical protein